MSNNSSAQNTTLPTDLKPEETDSIKAYAAEVSKVFGEEFDKAGNRFKGSKKLLKRFVTAIAAVLANGRVAFSGVEETHNELCIASQLLANPDPRFALLEYEPPLPGCSQSIDFRATTEAGLIYFVDVKTITPKPKDRWEQFERAKRENLLPPNVRVILSPEWLGGEMWHAMFAARSRMLQYTLELETKISKGSLSKEKTFFLLALCGNGFHWEEDDLEDFVAFYASGVHRADDPFSKMELHELKNLKDTRLNRTISRFSYMARTQFETRPRRLNWNVQPPKYPVF